MMMKTNRRLWSALLVATVVGVASLTAFSPVAFAAGNGVARQEVSAVVDSTLSVAEEEGLLYMREEEKLARDVYEVLYDKWGLPVFQNIANSEQTHMDAVYTLLERYDMPDPVADREAGEFANAELQALYDELVAAGMQSLEQALRVGATIEEVDILDLEKHLAETDNADILRVYENLNRGSRNHLRAFVSTLSTQEGVTYQPQYLSQEAYDAIISGSTERGGRSDNGAGRAGRGNRGGLSKQ
jgi:hypothetical protein